MNETTTALITIEGLPVIVEQLQQVKDKWAAIAEQAKNMIATDETVQAVKAMRADMRKEFDLYDKQRIAAKKQYLAPWDALEAAYKECVKDSFTAADTALKNAVDSFETELKRQAETELREYFDELCRFERIDFLTFETAMNLAGLKISLADAKSAGKKKLREGLSNIMAKVSADVDRVEELEDDAEIMVEYKKCFDVGQAVAIVQGRKRRIQSEQEAAEARRTARERQEAAAVQIPTFEPPIVTEAQETHDTAFYDVTFTCYGITREQAIKIKNFLKQEGINYG